VADRNVKTIICLPQEFDEKLADWKAKLTWGKSWGIEVISCAPVVLPDGFVMVIVIWR
jgi:hypothetical protein